MTALLSTLFIFHRILSGLRNGLMYKNHSPGTSGPAVTAGAMCIVCTVISCIVWDNQLFAQWWMQVAVIGLSIGSAMCTIIALDYYYGITSGSPFLPYTRELHLWTLGEQTALAALLCMTGWQGIAAAVLSVYPSVFLQKSAINLLTGQSIWYNGTDDESGKYYSIPSLGIRIPRSTQKRRVWIALASVVAIIIIHQYL